MLDRITPILRRARAAPWLLLALVAGPVVLHVAPWQLGVFTWSVLKLGAGLWLGYWAYRELHPYARPHELEGEDRRNAILARALIIAAVVLALGLGV